MVDRVAEMLIERGVNVKKFHDNTSKNQSTNLNTIVNWHNAQPSHQLDCSIHFNAFDHTAHGTEVLYVTQQALAAELSAAIAAAGHFKNRGAKHRSDLAFLNGTRAAAVLIETAFCDHTGDSNLYMQNFEAICDAIADVLGGAGDSELLPPIEPPIEELPDDVLFHAIGKCSHFGGPTDTTGVSASEGLAFLFDVMDKPEVFLPYQPEGTTGLARRLNGHAVNYIACRWLYDITPKSMLKGPQRALVRAIDTGIELLAHPVDWGPNEEVTGGRVADLSPCLMEALQIETDDQVEVIYPWRE
jgi:hypothetical protein